MTWLLRLLGIKPKPHKPSEAEMRAIANEAMADITKLLEAFEKGPVGHA